MADVKPSLLNYIALADVIARLTVAELIAKIIGRNYCHYVCEMVIPQCNYCLLMLRKVACVIAIIVCGRW